MSSWADLKSCTYDMIASQQALAEKNIISRSLVKNSHNAGSKSYACWGEDMVSNLDS